MYVYSCKGTDVYYYFFFFFLCKMNAGYLKLHVMVSFFLGHVLFRLMILFVQRREHAINQVPWMRHLRSVALLSYLFFLMFLSGEFCPRVFFLAWPEKLLRHQRPICWFCTLPDGLQDVSRWVLDWGKKRTFVLIRSLLQQFSSELIALVQMGLLWPIFTFLFFAWIFVLLLGRGCI